MDSLMTLLLLLKRLAFHINQDSRPRLMEGKVKMNPDLEEERRGLSFNPRELAAVLHGSEAALALRKQLHDIIAHNPDDPNILKAFDLPVPVEFQSRAERYKNAVRRTLAGLKVAETLTEEQKTMPYYFDSLILAGEESPLSLHTSMFTSGIKAQMNEEQLKKWLPLSQSMAIIGTYAQTEMGHGSNLKMLETTATYHPSTQEFIINTPTLTATKWWPGNLGKTSNHALVMAQLWSLGKCHGPHLFMVQLRDTDTHMPLPGVRVGDIGPKLGFVSNDNGYASFDHVRIPREQMLMRNAQIEPDGTFRPSQNPKLNYGAMVYIRAGLTQSLALALAKASAISIRYSCVRRQGEITPGEGEVKILDYQTQQYRLFPQLAKAFAFHAAGTRMLEIYTSSMEQIMSGNNSVLPELHALSCGLKAVVSFDACNGIEQCRLACGGHGYLQASGIPAIYTKSTPACTYEGDNIILLLQVSRFLVKAGRDPEIARASPTASYLTSTPTTKLFNRHSVPEAFEELARRQLQSALLKLEALKQQGISAQDAWNLSSVQLCKAARVRHYQAHTMVFLTRSFEECVRSQSNPSIRRVLEPMRDLFLLEALVKKSPYLLQDGLLSSVELESARNQIYACLAIIRPSAVGLVDSWDFMDRELRSVLGRYDGNVYENLLPWAEHSTLNQSEVSPAHYKYFGPMMEESRSKL